MTADERKENLRLLEIAIQNFPKVLERQKREAEHKKEMMRRFEPFSKALLKLQQQKEDASTE